MEQYFWKSCGEECLEEIGNWVLCGIEQQPWENRIGKKTRNEKRKKNNIFEWYSENKEINDQCMNNHRIQQVDGNKITVAVGQNQSTTNTE